MPPRPQCFVNGCFNISGRKNCANVSFHRFRPETYDAWCRALNILGIRNINARNLHNYYVCSNHFPADSFEVTYNSNYRTLKKGSVPTLHLRHFIEDNYESQMQEQVEPCTSNKASIGSTLSTDSASNVAQVAHHESKADDALSSPASYKSGMLKIRNDIPQFEKLHPSELSSACSDTTTSPLTTNTQSLKRLIRKIHSYSHSPNYMRKRLKRLEIKNAKLQNEKKLMKRKIQRLQIELKRMSDARSDVLRLFQK